MFVNFDREAAPLRNYFGPVLDIIAGSGIDSGHPRALQPRGLAVAFELEDDARELSRMLPLRRWPIRASARRSTCGPENYDLTAHGWFSSQVGHVRPSALEGRSRVEIYDVAGEVAQSQYHLLWPNTTISINPGFPNLSLDVWSRPGPTRPGDSPSNISPRE